MSKGHTLKLANGHLRITVTGIHYVSMRGLNLVGDKTNKMMSVKVLLQILIFSVWLSLAFGSLQSDKVV